MHSIQLHVIAIKYMLRPQLLIANVTNSATAEKHKSTNCPKHSKKTGKEYGQHLDSKYTPR